MKIPPFTVNTTYNSSLLCFDTMQPPLSTVRMEYMFHSASSFTGEGIEGFVTDSLTDLHGAFFKTRALKETLNLSSWNTSQVVDFSQTFYGSNLVDGGVGAWDTSNALNMEVRRILVFNDIRFKSYIDGLCHYVLRTQHRVGHVVTGYVRSVHTIQRKHWFMADLEGDIVSPNVLRCFPV